MKKKDIFTFVLREMELARMTEVVRIFCDGYNCDRHYQESTILKANDTKK